MRWKTWQQRRWQWSLPLAFFLLNLAVFIFYHYAYAGDVEQLQERIESERQALAELESDGGGVTGLYARLQQNREGADALYDEYFATESRRFTRAVAEIKFLCRTAGLEPEGFTYPDEALEGYDLIQREIVFQVEGTYEQLRTLVNLIELSEQFLTLERVSLSESGGFGNNPRLGIRLALSTVFGADADVEGEEALLGSAES